MVLSEAAYGTLRERGHVTGDGRRILCDCRPACRWMAHQMEIRLGPPPRRNCYPLWAWATSYGIQPLPPPSRCTEPLASGAPGILLEVEVPVEKVLLSDLALWHCVVNNWYLSASEEEDLAFDMALCEAGVSWGWPYPEPFRSWVERSWDRIFALDQTIHHFCGPVRGHPVQAKFWVLSLDQVRSVSPYHGSPRPEPMRLAAGAD